MDVYELALNEYNNKTEEQQQKVIYSYFGLAVYFSQCIEETFSNMLIFHRIFQKKITKEEDTSFDGRYRKFKKLYEPLYQ